MNPSFDAVEVVRPAMYTLSLLSTIIPLPWSSPLPPRYVEYASEAAPTALVLTLVRKLSPAPAYEF